MDYRAMFDRDYIGAWDLNGKEVVVTISRVSAESLIAEGGRKSKKPVVWFHGKEKGFVLNKTNAKTIATMYGNNTELWVDREIAIYPTTTSMADKTVDCIRVRPQIPQPPTRTPRSPKTESPGAAS